MKSIQFIGRSLNDIRAFPDTARRETGLQLDRVQRGLDPTDWKPMPIIGHGVRELRISVKGQFRVIYTANLQDRVAVLHAFRKKTQKTRRSDVEQARMALKELRGSVQE